MSSFQTSLFNMLDIAIEQSHNVGELTALLQKGQLVNTMADNTWHVYEGEQGLSDCNHKQQLVFVGQAINLSTLAKITEYYLSSAIHCVFSLHPLHGQFSQQAIALELSFNEASECLSKAQLNNIATAFFIDCFEVSKVKAAQAGLLVMDMDSTIINMECIDEIAALVGVGDKVSALTERAMQGELDFNQSLHARVGCLAGIPVTQLASLKSRLPVNPGFAETMQILQQQGWTTVIASGGFTYFADYLKEVFTLSSAVSNTLGINHNKLTGTVEGDIVNGEKKREVLLSTQQQKNIDNTQTVAIGDGANDLLMMEAAELGVAYKAKPKVKVQADACIEYCGFEGLLYCLRW